MSAWKMWQIILAFGKEKEYNWHSLPVIQRLQNKRYVWDLKAKENLNSEGKKESWTYDELLQIKWLKEAPPVFSHIIKTAP